MPLFFLQSSIRYEVARETLNDAVAIRVASLNDEIALTSPNADRVSQRRSEVLDRTKLLHQLAPHDTAKIDSIIDVEGPPCAVSVKLARALTCPSDG